jgi:hypothetical protein
MGGFDAVVIFTMVIFFIKGFGELRIGVDQAGGVDGWVCV